MLLVIVKCQHHVSEDVTFYRMGVTLVCLKFDEYYKIQYNLLLLTVLYHV